jgi:hypothetical protein
MDITGKITGIKYKVLLAEDLQIFDLKGINVNSLPSCCLLKDNNHYFAVSKWVSPKRTRSYPYERVYNTLNISKKITIIPVIKDEGADGDRDFLQWDTVSLMSLLDVFVIFAYYNGAKKNSKYSNKITDFQFDNNYVISKIKEIEQYHSSALHWNLNELKNNLNSIIDTARNKYLDIANKTGVKLHNEAGIENFKEKISKDVTAFMNFSRDKAQKAQAREINTVQPKESLSTLTKAKITITNYLGGQYFFTADEVEIKNNTIYLIESKHSKTSVLPSKGDIKDGLLKMILYSNLLEVFVDGVQMKCKVVLKLTSTKYEGSDKLNYQQKAFVDTLLKEARENGFEIRIEKI